MSTQRLEFENLAPDVFRAMVALHKAACRYVDQTLVDLILIRVSQINQCAYCLDMHIREARRHGETDERIFHLGAWPESPVFSEKEKAVLAFAEAVTVLTDRYVNDDVYLMASKYFDEIQMAGLIAVITSINAWNRINVASRKTPGTR